MGRPQKQGLDYFPLNVDIDQDDKIAMIEAIHGIEGFGIVIKLLMKIYKEGYFYKWTECEQILFSKRVNIDIKRINAIINDCLKWNIFNKKLYDEYQVLTSNGIQARYLEIVKRRTSVELINEYILVTDCILNAYNNIVNVNINSINADINGVNVNIGTQRKGNKRTEKKTKEPDTDILLQISNLRLRYSENDLKIIDSYMDILKWTRKNGRIADSVILKIYQEWEKFPKAKVLYALNIYVSNPKYHDKKENYCFGIMRNATAEEIENKRSNQQESKSIYRDL
ncbi:MAG TPA: hypothetical protein DIV40_05900 [Clostridiales bacterium]|nr:hypothetical protein [Clostridiales bacterium]